MKSTGIEIKLRGISIVKVWATSQAQFVLCITFLLVTVTSLILSARVALSKKYQITSFITVPNISTFRPYKSL